MAEYKDIEYIIGKLSTSLIVTDDLYGMGVQAGVDTAIKFMQETPAAKVKEVKYGKWIHTDWATNWHAKDECSECHFHTHDRIDLSYFNYCPNCGVEMTNEEE